ncbi:MAG: hypothetical protein R3C01_14460 [Planctomycetaceae bacterium]
MLGLLINAAVLGLIIAVIEQDEFPGWFNAGVCGFLASAATVGTALGLTNGVDQVDPSGALMILGVSTAVGAVVGAIAVWLVCDVQPKNAMIIASIFVAYKVALSIVCHYAM